MRNFKFRIKGDPIVYTAEQKGKGYNVTWPGIVSGGAPYTKKEARYFIARREWIVI